MPEKSMTYAGSGVDYSAMDPFKRKAQAAALTTNAFMERFGFKLVPWSRGESVQLIDTPLGYFGFVIEGLGTKNLVADELYRLAKELLLNTTRSFYDNAAQCNFAMAGNDAITLGTLPFIFSQYFAVGESKWFEDEARCNDVIEGTRKACELARCTWAGGETPTLLDIVLPGASELAGGVISFLPNKKKVFNPAKIRPGDVIVFYPSSGIHANGLTLARKIAKKLPKGFLTEMPDGRTYGETLLDPTCIYAAMIEELMKEGIVIHYLVNITGHGWRKLMRAPQEDLAYIIDRLPPELPIFQAMQEWGPVSDVEGFGNLNMGAGIALIMPEIFARRLPDIHISWWARGLFVEPPILPPIIAGYVEHSREKRVLIHPKGIEFKAETLAVR
jgi:phosphoribosylformylglycinamidine cyclo-ligase